MQRLPANELCGLKNLKTVHLEDNALTNLASLGTSSGCLHSLQAAHLDGNAITALAYGDVSQFLGRNLTRLSITRNKISR